MKLLNSMPSQVNVRIVEIELTLQLEIIVHSLSSGKVEMFLCAACHAFTPHVNAWKR